MSIHPIYVIISKEEVDNMKYTFINANSDLGVHIDGSNKGPNLITKNFLNYEKITIEKTNTTKKSKDKSDLAKNLDSVNSFNKLLFDKITNILNENKFPITIGGDHSIAIASALASNNYHKNIGIIWIDAHTDYNTFDTTITGNLHGLPLAAINGYKTNDLTKHLTNNYINPQNTVIVGARSIDELELVNLKNNNVTVFTTEDIKKEGINSIMKKAFEIAGNNTEGIHISYDLDYIDPIDAPGVSVPEENGIDIQTAIDTMEYIKHNKHLIKSLDLVEYNPEFDIKDKTLNYAIKLINTFLK